MEACGGAHHWARRLQALGHDVRLIPPIYVKPFVVRNKNDQRDADGLCQAVRLPDIRTVPIKTAEQQGRASLQRVRDLLVRQRTQAANQIRGLAAEFGLVARQGAAGLAELIAAAGAATRELPDAARRAIAAQTAHHTELDRQIDALTDEIVQAARACETARRLMTIPTLGPLCADAFVTAAPAAAQFRSGRDFAAWLGLTQRGFATGGKPQADHGPISKRGDKKLRRLLVLGATAVVARQRRSPNPDPWIAGLLKRRPFRVVAVALAAKTARIIWALLMRGGTYQKGHKPHLVAP
jgi:transposase